MPEKKFKFCLLYALRKKIKKTSKNVLNINVFELRLARDVVSVETSRSRDGLETH